MTSDSTPGEPPVGPRRSWRTADIPVWALIGGMLAVAAAALGLASLGSAFGIAAVAVLLAAVVGLLWFWGREQLLGRPD